MARKMNKEYIGDSVHVEISQGAFALDERGLTVTTENGFGPTNTIYLGAESSTRSDRVLRPAQACCRDLRDQEMTVSVIKSRHLETEVGGACGPAGTAGSQGGWGDSRRSCLSGRPRAVGKV